MNDPTVTTDEGGGLEEFVSQDPPSTSESPAAPAAPADPPTRAAGDPADETDDELAADVSGDIAELSGDIAELAAERDQFKNIAQRLQADFENFRKAVTARQAAEIERATGSLAEALLPVLDAAEAAYVGHPDEVGPLLNLLLTELKKQGLESIDLLGQPFDPNLADAVAHESGDGGEVVIAEVLRSGYTWNGRTLRPAMVRTRD